MRQPWIYSPFVDLVFIIGVPFVVVLTALFFSDYFGQPDSMHVASWAILVMSIDVSHVYSTIYRTYLDRDTMRQHSLFLLVLPLGVLVACMMVYSFGPAIFWRAMAYLAVFHFARQQYGFLRMYARQENQNIWQRRVDATAIYTATLYPIVDWHLAGQKNFNWFVKGDFFYFSGGALRTVALAVYVLVVACYVGKELHLYWKSAAFNLPRNGILAGTLLSWYVGIIHFNSDLAFTAINVMSHGVPYIALVWIFGNKKYYQKSISYPTLATFFKPRYVAFFALSLLLLSYIEEGLWNALVWHEKEHAVIFAPFHAIFSGFDPESDWLKLLVPLFSVPQITHYIIDGFIWKIRSDKYGWRDAVLSR